MNKQDAEKLYDSSLIIIKDAVKFTKEWIFPLSDVIESIDDNSDMSRNEILNKHLLDAPRSDMFNINNILDDLIENVDIYDIGEAKARGTLRCTSSTIDIFIHLISSSVGMCLVLKYLKIISFDYNFTCLQLEDNTIVLEGYDDTKRYLANEYPVPRPNIFIERYIHGVLVLEIIEYIKDNLNNSQFLLVDTNIVKIIPISIKLDSSKMESYTNENICIYIGTIFDIEWSRIKSLLDIDTSVSLSLNYHKINPIKRHEDGTMYLETTVVISNDIHVYHEV